MRLEFSGSPTVSAPRERVWQRLIDPHFVAASAPGIESVEVIDPRHFRVTSGFGPGAMRTRVTLNGELFDLVPGGSARMRLQGRAAGSTIEVVSSMRLSDAEGGKVRLEWSATGNVSGTLAGVGARILEGVVRRLTEQFWIDFARRVAEE